MNLNKDTKRKTDEDLLSPVSFLQKKPMGIICIKIENNGFCLKYLQNL